MELPERPRGWTDDASNPEDLRLGFSPEHVRLAKAVVVDALLSQVVASGASRATALHARQRTVATAVPYFWRFYQRGSFATDEPVLVAWRASRSRARRWRTPCTTTPSSWRWRARSPPRRTRTRRGGSSSARRDALLPCELRVLDALKFDLTPYDPHAALQEVLRGGRRLRRRSAPRRTRRTLDVDGWRLRRREGEKENATTTKRPTTSVVSRRVGRLERFARHADVCLGLGARGRGRRGRRGVRAPRRRAPGDGVPGRRKRRASPAPPLTSRRASTLAARRDGASPRGVRGKRRLEGARWPRRGAVGRARGWRARPLTLAAARAQAAQIIEAARRRGGDIER